MNGHAHTETDAQTHTSNKHITHPNAKSKPEKKKISEDWLTVFLASSTKFQILILQCHASFSICRRPGAFYARSSNTSNAHHSPCVWNSSQSIDEVTKMTESVLEHSSARIAQDPHPILLSKHCFRNIASWEESLSKLYWARPMRSNSSCCRKSSSTSSQGRHLRALSSKQTLQLDDGCCSACAQHGVARNAPTKQSGQR